MSNFRVNLNNIKIASPCEADWDSMFGNERKRFCGQCKLNVYNLSGMSRAEAEALLEQSEGRLCVRYFRRADGTILTEDCPVGWAKVKKRVSAFATAAFAIFVSAFSGAYFSAKGVSGAEVGKLLPIPLTTPTPKYEPLMGAVAMPSPTPTPKASPSPTPKIKMGRVVVRPVDPEKEAEEARLRAEVERAAGV